MRPVWLHVHSGRHFEETHEHAHCGKRIQIVIYTSDALETHFIFPGCMKRWGRKTTLASSPSWSPSSSSSSAWWSWSSVWEMTLGERVQRTCAAQKKNAFLLLLHCTPPYKWLLSNWLQKLQMKYDGLKFTYWPIHGPSEITSPPRKKKLLPSFSISALRWSTGYFGASLTSQTHFFLKICQSSQSKANNYTQFTFATAPECPTRAFITD